MLIRTFKEYVALSTLALMVCRDRGYSMYDLVKRGGNGEFPDISGSEHDRPAARASYTLLQGGQFAQNRNLNGVIAEMGEQVLANPHHSSEGAVIDAVIQILNLPYARNRIGSDALKSLRRALLLPDEVAKLRDTLSKKESVCVNCRRKLEPNELVTFNYAEDGNAALYCIKCVRPEVIPCHGCGETATIGQRLKSVIKATCLTCQAKAQGKEPPKEAPQEGLRTRVRQEILEAQQRVATRRGAALRNVPLPTFAEAENPFDDNA